MVGWSGRSKRVGVAVCGIMAIGSILEPGSFAATVSTATARQMPQMVEQYSADRMSLNRIYPLIIAPARMSRFEQFDNDEAAVPDCLLDGCAAVSRHAQGAGGFEEDDRSRVRRCGAARELNAD